MRRIYLPRSGSMLTRRCRDLQGQQLRYAGTTKASSWDDIMIDGHPDQLKFVAYYFRASARSSLRPRCQS